jgi:hypothetical protein
MDLMMELDVILLRYLNERVGQIFAGLKPAQDAPKRGRGRPPGSKNAPKVAGTKPEAKKSRTKR